MSEEQMPKNYRLLKGIVITLGILIIVMVIVLIVASVMKYNDQKRAEAALVEKYRASQQTHPVNSSPFEIDLSLLDNQEVISVQSSQENLLISIGQGGKVQKILLISNSGEMVGTINID